MNWRGFDEQPRRGRRIDDSLAHPGGVARKAAGRDHRSRSAHHRRPSSSDGSTPISLSPARIPCRREFRPQRHGDRFRAGLRDVSRGRAGRISSDRRDGIRQWLRRDERQRPLWPGAGLRGDHQPCRPFAGQWPRARARGPHCRRQWPLQRHPAFGGPRREPCRSHDLGDTAGGTARRQCVPQGLRGLGPLRAVVRRLGLSPADRGGPRSRARLPRDPDHSRSLRRPRRRRSLRGSTDGSVRRLEDIAARACRMPERLCEDGWSGDAGQRVRLRRPRSPANVGSPRRGLSTLYRNGDRPFRREAVHVREQLPYRQGGLQLPGAVERVQAGRCGLLS